MVTFGNVVATAPSSGSTAARCNSGRVAATTGAASLAGDQLAFNTIGVVGVALSGAGPNALPNMWSRRSRAGKVR
jgi:hypothetical protein